MGRSWARERGVWNAWPWWKHTSRCAVEVRPPGGAALSQTGPEGEERWERGEGGEREGRRDRKTDRERGIPLFGP